MAVVHSYLRRVVPVGDREEVEVVVAVEVLRAPLIHQIRHTSHLGPGVYRSLWVPPPLPPIQQPLPVLIQQGYPIPLPVSSLWLCYVLFGVDGLDNEI